LVDDPPVEMIRSSRRSDLEQYYYFHRKTEKEKFPGNFIFGKPNHQFFIAKTIKKIIFFLILTTSF